MEFPYTPLQLKRGTVLYLKSREKESIVAFSDRTILSFKAISVMLLTILLSMYFCGCDKGKHKENTNTIAMESRQIDLPKTIVGKDGAEMVLIPAGEFEMGTDPSEVPQLVQWAKKWYSDISSGFLFADEVPRHTVYLDAFYMDRYEVTNALYKKFMDATGHKAPAYWGAPPFNAPDQPVVSVSWDDAKAYAEWAGKRLPTEAQWEKAARGGLAGKRFPWGDSDPDGSQCNFADKSVDDGHQSTAPVGSFIPNGYGLYDMAGNVWEWCADWYDSGYYANSPSRNPTGPGSGTPRVLRGGSWNFHSYGLRIAYRYFMDPTTTFDYTGFRCVSQE